MGEAVQAYSDLARKYDLRLVQLALVRCQRHPRRDQPSATARASALPRPFSPTRCLLTSTLSTRATRYLSLHPRKLGSVPGS